MCKQKSVCLVESNVETSNSDQDVNSNFKVIVFIVIFDQNLSQISNNRPKVLVNSWKYL